MGKRFRQGHALSPRLHFNRAIATKISRVRRSLHLPRNLKGRDLVVGDLHGHRLLFEQELARLQFDPGCDRVLSVGDLIDRGPQSLETLTLIEEPWFHAVLGNHELMLLNFLGCYESRVHSRKSFPTGGGEWVNEASSKDRKELARLAHRIALLPLSIHVDDDIPFNVTHAALCPTRPRQGIRRDDETVCVHQADLATSSRDNISAALKCDLLGLRFAQHSVQTSPTPLAALPITYAGHSPIRQVTAHKSFVFIDQGVCTRASKRGVDIPPTVLDHRSFAYWLRGVATARGQAGPASRSAAQRPGALSELVALA